MRNTDENADYDRRQYQRMLDLIARYQEGEIVIRILVDNLDALRQALTNPSKPWIERFEHLWGVLEDAYAVMLDNKETQLNPTLERIVDQALVNLVPLIKNEVDLHDGRSTSGNHN